MEKDRLRARANTVVCAAVVGVSLGALALFKDEIQERIFSSSTPGRMITSDPTQGCYEYIVNEAAKDSKDIPEGKQLTIEEQTDKTGTSWTIRPFRNQEIECKDTREISLKFTLIRRRCIKKGRMRGMIEAQRSTAYSLADAVDPTNGETRRPATYNRSRVCAKPPHSLEGPLLEDI